MYCAGVKIFCSYQHIIVLVSEDYCGNYFYSINKIFFYMFWIVWYDYLAWLQILSPDESNMVVFWLRMDVLCSSKLFCSLTMFCFLRLKHRSKLKLEAISVFLIHHEKEGEYRLGAYGQAQQNLARLWLWNTIFY